MANPLNYADATQAIRAYYETASSADVWNLINTYDLQPAQLYELLPEAHQLAYAQQITNAQQIANSTPFQVVSNSGTPQYAVANLPVPTGDGGIAESVFNSNAQSGSASNTFISSQVASPYQVDEKIQYRSGANLYEDGQSVGRTLTLASQVTAGIAAVATGLSLGKKIDGALYAANPNFWDSIGLSTLNPETWSIITSDMKDTGAEGAAKTVLNLLLGIKPNGDTQAYIKKDAYEYLAYAMAQAGIFDPGLPGTQAAQSATQPTASDLQANGTRTTIDSQSPFMVPDASKVGGVIFKGPDRNGRPTYYCIVYASAPVNGWQYIPGWGVRTFSLTEKVGDYYTLSSYMGSISGNTGDPTSPFPYFTFGKYLGDTIYQPGNGANIGLQNLINAGVDLGSFINQPPTSLVEGIGNQPNATIPDISSSDTPETISPKITSTLPYLNDNRLEVPVLQQDGTITNDTYYPVPLPISRNDDGQPTGDPEQNVQQSTTDEDSPKDEIALLLKLLLQRFALDMPQPQTDPETDKPTETPPTTNPPDTGSGDTPPLIVPVGSASALWAVYNPNLTELNQFGAWLWSNNFVDQLLKMFNDPMQAIIGLHRTFIPPATGARQNIIVGYLDSGVSCLTVPTQYSTVDCGTIDCAEYFGNVFDYAPYTKVYIYLPFIGFRELDVSQVMRSRINVKYHGDAFTGACLAEVSVTRDAGAGGVLYTFSGDCAARYPLSHGSYMGIANAIAGLALGIAGTATGTPVMGAMGALSMVQHARVSVEHSGGFTGNSGAMGIKKPYLVILRPQTAMADNYQHFTGQPANHTVTLGNATGYVRVKEVHVEDIMTATDTERTMIETALKEGVLI